MAGSDTPTPTRDTLVDPGPLTLCPRSNIDARAADRPRPRAPGYPSPRTCAKGCPRP